LKTSRVTPAADRPLASAEPRSGLIHSWVRFWFAPVDPLGFHCLRVMAGLLFLFWLLSFAGHQGELFGLGGWLDEQAYREAGRIAEGEEGPPVPISWSILYLAQQNAAILNAMYWGSIICVALFTLGLWTRLTGILAWVIVASFIANPAISYDADYLLVILAFYLMIGYVLFGLWSQRSATTLGWLLRWFDTRDTWLFGRRWHKAPASHAANLGLRLFQVHFAIVVVTSGLHKLQFGEWWSGAAFWYPLHPPFETTMEQLQREAVNARSVLGMLSLAGYAVLAWQIAFPFFAWKGGWCRVLLLGGGVIGWLGSLFLCRLPLFGPIYFIACVSYLSAAEWQWIAAMLARLPGFTWMDRTAEPAPGVKQPVAT